MWNHKPPLSLTPPVVTTDEELAAAKAARAQSTAHFFSAVDAGLEVRKIAKELRDKRIANNWGPMLDKAMKPR